MRSTDRLHAKLILFETAFKRKIVSGLQIKITYFVSFISKADRKQRNNFSRQSLPYSEQSIFRLMSAQFWLQFLHFFLFY